MIEIEVSAGNFKRAADLPGQWSIKTVSSTNYTITDIDGYDAIFVITGASDRIITLPSIIDNLGRKLVIMKVDTGVGKVTVDGAGSEKIIVHGNEHNNMCLETIGDRIEILCDEMVWLYLNGKYSHMCFYRGEMSDSSDNFNVANLNFLEVITGYGNIILGGLTGGIEGQVLSISKKFSNDTLIIENIEGVGDQDIYTKSNANINIAWYGGIQLICNGYNWYEV